MFKVSPTVKRTLFSILLFLCVHSSGMCESKINYKTELFYTIKFGVDPYIGYNREIEDMAYFSPYKLTVDYKGDLWIVDPIKKRCVIINGKKNIKFYKVDKRFKNSESWSFFDILAIDKNKILLSDRVIDIKTQKTIFEFQPTGFIVSAGFTKNSGAFINTITSLNRLTVLDHDGREIISSFFSDYKKDGIVGYYYDPFSQQAYKFKKYKMNAFLINLSSSYKRQINQSSDHIKYIDKKGYFYFIDGHFICQSPAEETVLLITDKNINPLKELIFKRKFSQGKARFNFEFIENIIDITSDGIIYYSRYIPGNKVEIYRLVPII